MVSKVMAVAAATLTMSIGLQGVSQADEIDGLLIINGSGKCLEIANSSAANGADAQQWSCVGQRGALWELIKAQGVAGDGYYWIRNVYSGKCLEIENSWTHNGAQAQQWTCTIGATGQIWRTGGLSWTRIPSKSLYNPFLTGWLEVENSSTSNGARVQRWDYANTTGQVWKTNFN